MEKKRLSSRALNVTGTSIRMMEEKGKGTRKNIRVSRKAMLAPEGTRRRSWQKGSGKDKGRTGEGQREG